MALYSSGDVGLPSIYDDLWHGTNKLNLGIKTIKEVSTNSEIYNI
jgi:hypothetical protein